MTLNFRRTVLIPLIVMLLLTLLLGGTTFQLAERWQSATRQSTQTVTRALLLNNLRWKLVQVRQAMADHPEQVPLLWQDVRDIGTLLSQSQSDVPPSLQTLLRIQPDAAGQVDPQVVDALVAQPIFSINLSQLTHELDAVGDNATFITLSLTLSMLFLGAVLTGITARDLNRLFAALVASRDLNTSLQEDERRRIAQDLHDGVVQELVDLKRHYEPDKVDVLIDNIRRVCHNLKPQVLEDLGLTAALEFLAEDLQAQEPVEVALDVDPSIETLPKRYDLPLFRIFQEGMSNIRHHARAQQVRLSLRTEKGRIIGQLYDNGRGFDLTDPQSGMGLTGMEERVRQLGGTFHVESEPAQGTRLDFKIPYRPQGGPA